MINQEKQLVKACIKGKSKAQTRLYALYHRRLFGVCLRYASSNEVAEDILQEGFCKIFRDLHQFKFQGSLYGWMRKVVVTTALMHIRKSGKITFTSMELPPKNYSEAPHILKQLEAEAILKMIQKLPQGFRTIFNLYAIEDFSHKEIADLLDISESTSRSQYTRARKALQHLIIKEQDSIKVI